MDRHTIDITQEHTIKIIKDPKIKIEITFDGKGEMTMIIGETK